MEGNVPPDNVADPAFSRKGFLDSLSAGLGAAWLAGSPADEAPGARQTGILEACETTPVFRTMREYTMMGCFGDPSYGGNRGKAGWKLIGFEGWFAWQAPFGHYDDQDGGAPR